MKTKPEIEQSLWGPVQSCTKVAEGIWAVGTAGHGGYVLSEERAKQFKEIMPLFSSTFSSSREFEEDMDCIAVVLAFPECFSSSSTVSILIVLIGVIVSWTVTAAN